MYKLIYTNPQLTKITREYDSYDLAYVRMQRQVERFTRDGGVSIPVIDGFAVITEHGFGHRWEITY